MSPITIQKNITMSDLAVLNESQGVSVFNSKESFEQAQRMIIPLMQSTMVPDTYKSNGANCMVAMEMSHRLKISVLEVMQNMQIVKGNVGWKSEYVVNKINASGIFKDALDYVFSDDRQSCYATAVRKSNKKELRGTTVSMELARAEGWLTKNGSKWVTMPEQMLMYRAATFFCRVFCPEVLAGVQTADEIIDIGHVEVVGSNQSISKFNEGVKPSTDNAQAAEDFAENQNFEEVEEVTEHEHETAAEMHVEAEEVVSESAQEVQEEDDDF